MKVTSSTLDSFVPANGQDHANGSETGHPKTGNFGAVTLTKKVNLPKIGLVDAFCHVDLDLKDGNLDDFEQRLRLAFRAFQKCDEIMKDELVRTGSAKGKDATTKEQEAERLMSSLLLDGEEAEETPALGKRAEEPASGVATKVPAKPAPAKPAPKPARPLTEDELEARRKARKNYAIIAGCAVVVALVWFGGSSPPNPDRLATTALSAGELKQRVEAATMLAMITNADPTSQLRLVAEKTKDPDVLIQALNGLSARQHYLSLPLFYNALENPSDTVQSAAWAGVQRILSGAVPEGAEYRVNAPLEERSRVANRLREVFDQRAKSKF